MYFLLLINHSAGYDEASRSRLPISTKKQSRSMKRQHIALGLTCLLTLALGMSAAMKLAGSPEVIEGFTKMGLGDWRVIIAMGEIAGAALFFIPKTRNFGALVLSSYMGGAIMAHMSHGEAFTAPAIFLILIWITAGLREPGLFGLKAGN
jgi:amino acid permease